MSGCEHPIGDRLCDGGLPRPGQPVQPVDRRLVEIPCPEFDLVQDGSSGSLQTTCTVVAIMQMFGPVCTGETAEDALLGPCQVPVPGSGKPFNLCPVERGYWVVLDTMGIPTIS